MNRPPRDDDDRRVTVAPGQGSAGDTRPVGDDTIILKTGELTLLQQAGAPTRRRSCLILYGGSGTGRRFILEGARMTIGRQPSAEVFVDHPSVSRRHAELEIAGERVTLRDLGSANGTHLNDRRIDAPTPLRDGDLIRLGKVFLKFYERESLDVLLHDRIYRMATIDALTQVFNRQYLIDALGSEMRQATLNGRPLSLLYIDLDHFKQVNDRYGHDAGDRVLTACAAIVGQMVRKDDVLGRLGGEEFAVVLPGASQREASALAERVRVAVAAQQHCFEVEADGGRRAVMHQQTVSIGVAELTAPLHGARELLEQADRALYRAKQGGRNRVAT